MSASVEAFLFDLDGVVTDTAEYHFRSWKRVADEQGIPFTRRDNERLRGVPRDESLRRLLKGRSVPPETFREMMDRKNRYYQEYIRQMTPAEILPGVSRLFEEIRSAGLRLAIASASKNARTVVERLGLHDRIDALCDGYSTDRQKPAPDLFLHAARQVGVPPARCVVVEDAEDGVAAGKAAGMFTLGIGPPERVGAADLVLPDLVDASLSWILEHLPDRPGACPEPRGG